MNLVSGMVASSINTSVLGVEVYKYWVRALVEPLHFYKGVLFHGAQTIEERAACRYIVQVPAPIELLISERNYIFTSVGSMTVGIIKMLLPGRHGHALFMPPPAEITLTNFFPQFHPKP